MNNANDIEEKDLRKSLNLVILGITFGNVFFVVTTGAALTGFTRALGAGDLVYGIIMAMPVIGGVIQIFASYYLEHTGKRRAAFLISGLVHRLLWIPIGLVPVLLPDDYRTARIIIVTALITIGSGSASITSISFLSWMGDLVPQDIRGRFFSKRAMISTISSAITGLIVGKMLDYVHGYKGFGIVFSVVAIFGAMDILCFIFIHHPQMKTSKDRTPLKKLILEPLKDKNYMRFVIFISVWNFGLNLAGPFFNVYMLENLKMGYLSIVLFSQVGGNLITIFFVRYWGKSIDKFGNKHVMKICCSIIVLLPFMWLFTTPDNYYVVLIINLMTGFFWPGFDMTSTNQSIWFAPQNKRSMYIAVYTLVTSIVGIAFAYVCGGLIMQLTRPLLKALDIPFVMGQRFSSFHVLFIVSGVVRLLALLFLSKRYKESKIE